jgi:hypothetical protein
MSIKYKILQKKGKSMKREALKALIDDLGKKYSEILDINLLDAEDEEIFK